MARLPSSFRARNRTTRSFREQYAALPKHIQDAVRTACVLFDRDPNANGLRLHPLKDHRKGSHLPSSWSVSVTMQYRALYVVTGDVNVWYWIGTHAEFDTFAG